jgi:hypothetical protein
MVNHPPHYNHPSGIRCIQVARLCGFNLGNAIKYIWRFGDKNGMEDLKKARWYLNDMVANGMASHLPHKAREVLQQVVNSETNAVRRTLFGLLIQGRIDETVASITAIAKDK